MKPQHVGLLKIHQFLGRVGLRFHQNPYGLSSQIGRRPLRANWWTRSPAREDEPILKLRYGFPLKFAIQMFAVRSPMLNTTLSRATDIFKSPTGMFPIDRRA